MAEQSEPMITPETSAAERRYEEEIAAVAEKIKNLIREIASNGLIPDDIKRDLIGRLSALSGTADIAKIEQVITNVRTDERAAEAKVVQEAVWNAIYAEYHLNEEEARRVSDMSHWIDTNDMKSIRRFTDALVDQDLPKDMQAEQSRLLATAIQKDPSIVAAHNAASPEARTQAMAAYVAAKRDFKSLETDPRYASIKEHLERADKLGLEADREVQQLLRDAKEGKIDPEALGQRLTTRNAEQIDVYRKELKHARSSMPEEIQRTLTEKFGAPDTPGSNKAIVQTALHVFKELKRNPNYQMTPEEKAAVQAFSLTKDIVITRILGDNALTIDKGISLEKDTGTLEQRTERAYALLQENMTPELANMPPHILKARISETLKVADQENIQVANMDTLSNADLYEFSYDISDNMASALARYSDAKIADSKNNKVAAASEQVSANSAKSPMAVAANGLIAAGVTGWQQANVGSDGNHVENSQVVATALVPQQRQTQLG